MITVRLAALLPLAGVLVCVPGCSGSDARPSSRDTLASSRTDGGPRGSASGFRSPGAPPSLPSHGRLYGFWGLNGFVNPSGLGYVHQTFGLTVFQMASDNPTWAVGTLLPMVKAAGVRITLRMTPDHGAYTTHGDFDLGAWKAHVADWEGSGVQLFIDDGTLVGHMLLDDIANFAGQNPTAAELDEMARYSNELLPGLMTYVREKATAMPVPSDGRYRYVDAIVNQYTAADGDVEVYAAAQAARAAALDLGVINGLNIADGGDGSSGQPGWRPGRHAMSAAEITTYGAVLATVPTCGMFLNWEYDGEERWADGSVGSAWFDRPPLRTALATLADLVASQPYVRLRRRDVRTTAPVAP
ncbi:MAG: hypothetical protein Q8P18_16325 [Pseudomonadota bacterium]|nr:hypothetical protein [Pseudomonadota bacterium]